MGALSEDMAIEVLRSSPASLPAMFAQLSPPARALAAITHIRGLEADCHPATAEHAGSGTRPHVVSVCVDATQALAELGINKVDDLVASTGSENASGVRDGSAASIWHGMHPDEEYPRVSGFFLEHRANTLGCSLIAKSGALDANTVQLPDSARLVFGPGSAALHLKNVTFQGVHTCGWRSVSQHTVCASRNAIMALC